MPRPRPARLAAALVAGALLAAAPPARSQPDDWSAPEPAPSAAGQEPAWRTPPEADRARAIELFREGNSYLRDALFPKAAATYREALLAWDHPAIHFNLAMALVNLDQPVEMREHLVAALAYGPGPLGDDHFERATQFLMLVERQLATVELTVSEPGAQLFFDGKPVFVGPGTWRALVPAGEHHVRATAPGKTTTEQTLRLPGGETHRGEIELYVTIWDDFGHREPLPTWLPPTITVSGVMAGAMGVWFHARGHAASQDYAEQLAACLPMDPGCGTRPELVALRTSASSERLAAFTLYGVGATSVALGVILWRYNRVRFDRFDADGNRLGSVTPFVGPGVAGLSAHGSF